MEFQIRHSLFAIRDIVERGKFHVLRRPGDDLLSQVLRHSTIGAEAFDGRVRDGIGSDRYAESHQAGEAHEMKQTGIFLPTHARIKPKSWRLFGSI